MEEGRGSVEQVVPGLYRLRVAFVNLYFAGTPGEGNPWVLVDAGLGYAAGEIAGEAGKLFGKGKPPEAIVLTHGHFDHVGALKSLAEKWDVPVYAHVLELPYLTGKSAYPPPDPTVGGGMMAGLSFLYPRGPVDLGRRMRALPADHSVPGMPGWRWIHTPGHSPGHVAFFRDEDRTLIAGDAFVTTRQESAGAVLQQRLEMHGPPAYFTPDWPAARASVETLNQLGPAAAATGHGKPVYGEYLKWSLQALVDHFELAAVPARGRYVRQPAIMDATGVVYVPPPDSTPRSPGHALLFGAAAAAGVLAVLSLKQRNRR